LPRKLTYVDVKKVFDERGFVLLDETYVNSETPMNYICACGNESKMSYKNAKKGRSCAKCGRASSNEKKRKFDFNFVKKHFEDNECTLLSTEFVSKRKDIAEKLDYVCKCGTKAQITWYQAYYSSTNCKHCRTLKSVEARVKYNIDEVKSLFKEQEKELLEDRFINSLTPMKYLCKCGTLSKISLNNFLAGKDCWECRNNKISEKKKSPHLTDEEREELRNTKEYKDWRIAVYRKDNFTCRCCGTIGKDLNAHHIKNFADNRDLRIDVSNGVTLCVECHREFHKTYGQRYTTEEQLNEFLRNKEAVL
jgi:hypothetical protein